MNRWRVHAVRGVMMASGFAALGYQLVWTQQAALWLGHEAAAVLAVVTAFFGGLALGAWVLGARIERSPHPARWYVACELAIAAWSLALVGLIEPFGGWMLALTGAQPSPWWQGGVAFGGTLVLLLPATAAMGATLPAMERLTAGLALPGASIAALYAANTFGAVLGALGVAFVLVPGIGLARSAVCCAVLNLGCALAVAAAGPRSAHPQAAAWPLGREAQPLLWTLAATGALGIGYEVLVVRVLSQVTEDTVYTFALLLAVYLVGTALGAAAHQRWLGRPGPAQARARRDRLLLALAAACLAGGFGLWSAEQLHGGVRSLLGAGMGPALAAEAALALAAFGLPTLVMGALFSELGTAAREAGVGFGRALAANTAGAAMAPLLFGVLLAPALGPKVALLLVVTAYLALLSSPARRHPLFGGVAAATVAVAVWAPPLAFVDVPDGGRVLSYRDDTLAAVSVVEDAEGVARLRIDNRQQEGSSATRLADARQALLPLLLHPAPRRVLFLGLGTGVTASAAAGDPGLQVDAVELLPGVIAASAHFGPAATGAPATRLHVMAADARRFVRAGGPRYDVIVADNFHPARSGSGALYTVEHFRAVHERLAADGLFCQWLPLHQLDLATLRSIVRSFLVAYPGGAALLATNSLETPVLGLLSRADGGRFPLRPLQARREAATSALQLADFGLADELAVLGSFVAGPRALARFAGDAPLNTDDHPVVAYRAPRLTYAPDSLPRERLLQLLSQWPAEAGAVVDDGGADPGWTPRLAAYWQARNRFLEAGREVRSVRGVRAMLAQVRDPLLSVLRISPDFRPAYDPLLRMAQVLGREDPAAARDLLLALAAVQPARTEAAAALRELAP